MIAENAIQIVKLKIRIPLILLAIGLKPTRRTIFSYDLNCNIGGTYSPIRTLYENLSI